MSHTPFRRIRLGGHIALGAFLAPLALGPTDRLTTAQGFYLMAPILGAAPALRVTTQARRGRAG